MTVVGRRLRAALGIATLAGLTESLAVSSRKILLLHGAGSDSAAFVNSPTSSGARNFLAGFPPRRRDPTPWQFTAANAGSDDGTWWKPSSPYAAKRDAYLGLEQSIASVEAVLAESGGQISGVVGHEQGGLLAALVAARAALGVGPSPLEFAVICGAAMPEPGSEWEALLVRLRETRPEASIETLHCLSRSGSACEQGEQLAACFAPSAEILWHDGGNAMPGPSWWKESRGFPDRATGRSQYVAGMHG